MNTARYSVGGAGLQTAALAFGGEISPGNTDVTESYDGTTWTSLSATLATARRAFGGSGTQTSAIAAGGFSPGNVNINSTEIFTGAGAPVTKTITTS